MTTEEIITLLAEKMILLAENTDHPATARELREALREWITTGRVGPLLWQEGEV